MQGIMLQVSCNSITLKKNENETFGLICIRIFLTFIVNILFLIFIIFTWVLISVFTGEYDEFRRLFFNACAAIWVRINRLGRYLFCVFNFLNKVCVLPLITNQFYNSIKSDGLLKKLIILSKLFTSWVLLNSDFRLSNQENKCTSCL